MQTAPARPRTTVLARTAGSYIPKLTKKVFEKHGFSAAALLTDWGQIVGADLASYSSPERLKWPKGVEAYEDTAQPAMGRPGATLVLRVEGARALDVQYRSRQIIERINAYFGYRAVTELRLIQGPVGAATPSRARPPLAAALSATAPDADPALEAVPDEGLRNALRRLQNGVRTWGGASRR